MSRLFNWFVLSVLALSVSTFCSCEKMVLDDDFADDKAKGNVTIRASLYDIVPFPTRAVQNIADYSSSLCYLFYQNGAELSGKRITQNKGDDGFGEATVKLEPGVYQVLLLAHSAPNGNPTLSHPDSIAFSNQTGYSDVFYYYGDLTVTGENQTFDISMKRATSMLSITITDAIPAGVKTIRVLYKGGARSFNALTGWGCNTNSEQQITFGVSGLTAPITLRAYTFLKSEELQLSSVVITAYNASNQTVAEKELKNVPMKSHMVTEYSGRLFSAASADVGFSMTADTAWDVFGQYTF